MIEQLDLFAPRPIHPSATDLRDAGIEQVLSHNEPWADAVMDFFVVWLRAQPPSFEFIAETFRAAAERQGLYPNHPNAWGGIFVKIKETKLVVNTGKFAPMRSPVSHARMTFIYRKL